MTFHTLTVHRSPVPAGEQGPQGAYLWQIETWCSPDGGPVTVQSGRAMFERTAYMLGLQAAHKLGLAIIGGDMRLGYELGVRSSYERVGGHGTNEHGPGLLP